MTGPVSTTSHDVASVLVVDDAPEVAALLEPLLRGRGFLVSVAVDGCSALEIIHRETPDVVILDIGLPDIDGFDVCQQAVEAGVPLVLLLSARGVPCSRIRRRDHQAAPPGRARTDGERAARSSVTRHAVIPAGHCGFPRMAHARQGCGMLVQTSTKATPCRSHRFSRSPPTTCR